MNNALLSKRYLSLWMPYLTADNWQRDHPELEKDNRPIVFVERSKGGFQIVAICERARRAGLRPGLSLADARARIPSLRAFPRDVRADKAILKELASIATAFTPSVAFENENGLVLDITGCVHLFGSEAELAARLRRLLQSHGVTQCRIAIAPTPDMARALARFGRGDALSVYDDQAVRSLTVAALECGSEDITALRRAGLKTIGDVVARPSVLFSARFSQAFTTKLARVLGEEDRRIVPHKTPRALIFDHVCAEPLINDAAIEVALVELAQRACQDLESRDEGGRRFVTTFFRTDGVIRRVPVEASRPLRDPEVILKLYNDRIQVIADPLDPGFGFDLIRFEVAHSEKCTSRQVSLDARDDRDERISSLCDRLVAMFGREHVLQLAGVNTHIPERAQIQKSYSENKRHHVFNSENIIPRPITLFERPHPLEIIESQRKSVPLKFRWRRKEHNIVHAEGPERISEEWWRPSTGFGTRDYFRVETLDGHRFWIFRSQVTPKFSSETWFLHGVFA